MPYIQDKYGKVIELQQWLSLLRLPPSRPIFIMSSYADIGHLGSGELVICKDHESKKFPVHPRYFYIQSLSLGNYCESPFQIEDIFRHDGHDWCGTGVYKPILSSSVFKDEPLSVNWGTSLSTEGYRISLKNLCEENVKVFGAVWCDYAFEGIP